MQQLGGVGVEEVVRLRVGDVDETVGVVEFLEVKGNLVMDYARDAERRHVVEAARRENLKEFIRGAGICSGFEGVAHREMAAESLDCCYGRDFCFDLLDKGAHGADGFPFEKQHEDTAARMGDDRGCWHGLLDDGADALQRRVPDGIAVELANGSDLRHDEHGPDVADLVLAQIVGELDARENHAAIVVEVGLLIDEVELALQLVVAAVFLDIAEFAEQSDNLGSLIDGIF